MKNSVFLPLFVTLMAATAVRGAGSDSSTPQTEMVAPGIWRLHFGDPEQFWNGLVPDFASPQVRKIFLKQNNTSLFDRNAESVKLEECDYQTDSPTPRSFPLATKSPLLPN